MHQLRAVISLSQVGANLGFFTLLAARRGYDVIAVEPAPESVQRLLHSIHRNGFATSSSPEDVRASSRRLLEDVERERAAVSSSSSSLRLGSVAREEQEWGTPSQRLGAEERMATVSVFHNGGDDEYGRLMLAFDAGNPGATSLRQPFDEDKQVVGARGEHPNVVDVVPLDDLRQFGVNPRHLAAVKINAEGMDARVLHGMRGLLAEGRPPFVMMVLNDAHVQQRGCRPRELILNLIRWGWRLWDYGVYRTTETEVSRFLSDHHGQSLEVLFVEQSVDF